MSGVSPCRTARAASDLLNNSRALGAANLPQRREQVVLAFTSTRDPKPHVSAFRSTRGS